MGSNPAQGKLSFKHLLLKYDYMGCALSGFLSYTLSLSIHICESVDHVVRTSMSWYGVYLTNAHVLFQKHSIKGSQWLFELLSSTQCMYCCVLNQLCMCIKMAVSYFVITIVKCYLFVSSPSKNNAR